MVRSKSTSLAISKLKKFAPVFVAAALILGGAITAPAVQGDGTMSVFAGQTAGTTGGTTGGPATGTTSGGATAGGATAGTTTTGSATAGTTGATTGTTPPPATTAGTTTATVPVTGGQAVTQVAPTEPAKAAARPEDVRFGLDVFREARAVIDARRRGGTPGTADPLKTPVGPDNLVTGSVNVPVPDRYQLGPGDRLNLRVGSPVQATTSSEIRIDPTGGVLVPGTPERVILRGQTLAQATQTIQRVARKYLRDATVDVQLTELRTISIRILGDAYAPGTYEVPAIITTFNALYAAGGPSDTGSFRNIELRRLGGVRRRVDLYGLLLQGDNSADVPLQPGDTLFIPPVDALVKISGEVRRPATYELRSGEDLKAALAFAGGVKATGVAQQIAVDSVKPGINRVLIDANLAKTGPANNPLLYDGDTVAVFSIRPIVKNAVTIEGAVDQPRTYALTAGMTVADLVTIARGTVGDTYLERADLYRTNSDGSTQLIPVRLRDALSRMANANIALRPDDRLRVYSISQATFLSPRRITVNGAVQRPGLFVRSDGMTVRDLLLQAGGLLPTANDRVGLLQRALPDGRPGPLLRVNLVKAAQGDAEANLLLQDDDVLTVNRFDQSDFFPEQVADITGAVLRPGTYTRAQGMRLRDLLEVAGGPLPTADLKKAFLQRANPNGTQGPLVVVNLEAVLAGNADANVEVGIKDKLTVFTQQETAYQVQETVTIAGAVQRAGTFPASSNMKLSDLVALAGGVMPYAANTLELNRAWSPNGAPLQRISVMDVLSGDPRANVEVKPGDQVTIPGRSDLQERAKLVYINGAVRFPGPYLITDSNDRLSNLVQRAGGLVESAFPAGAEFVRDPKYLTTPKQLDLQPRVSQTLALVADAEYRRLTALTDLDRLRIVFSQGATISGGGGGNLLPQLGGAGVAGVSQNLQPGVSLDQALAKALQSEAVTMARKLGPSELTPSGNIDIDMRAALRRPKSDADPLLKDGDVINVPETPTTVSISGAVVLPSAVRHKKGAGVEYYLERAGGLTSDASIEETLIIRATGGVIRYRKGIAIQLGDNILIPTKVQAVRLRENANALQTITQTVTSAGLTFALIRALTR